MSRSDRLAREYGRLLVEDPAGTRTERVARILSRLMDRSRPLELQARLEEQTKRR